jgi:anti-sigma regulatory factor (Ser/Thr protein kinase)
VGTTKATSAVSMSLERTPASHPISGYCHEALLYEDQDEFMREMLGFIREGADRGEPILVALSEKKTTTLKAALGSDADHVAFADMDKLGWNPARIIPAWDQFLASHPGQRVRGVGEPVAPGQDSEKRTECHRHEALLNTAFTDVQFWLLCPYDLSALDAQTVDEARRNHPFVRRKGKSASSPLYPGSRALAEPLHQALQQAPTSSPTLDFGADELADVRQFIALQAQRSGLDPTAIEDFVLAANEMATNSIRHGGGGGTVTAWGDRGWLYCEFKDRGLLTDPLAGRTLPSVDTDGGRGLWIANQICELVQIRVHQSGSQVRLRIPLSPPDA